MATGLKKNQTLTLITLLLTLTISISIQYMMTPSTVEPIDESTPLTVESIDEPTPPILVSMPPPTVEPLDERMEKCILDWGRYFNTLVGTPAFWCDTYDGGRAIIVPCDMAPPYDDAAAQKLQEVAYLVYDFPLRRIPLDVEAAEADEAIRQGARQGFLVLRGSQKCTEHGTVDDDDDGDDP